MANTNTKEIRRIFESAIKTLLSTYSVFFENTTVDCKNNIYVVTKLLPGRTFKQIIGLNAPTTEVGVFRVKVYGQKNTGVGAIEDVTAQIIEAFADTPVYSVGGKYLTVSRAYAGEGGETENARYMIPVNLEYYTHT